MRRVVMSVKTFSFACVCMVWCVWCVCMCGVCASKVYREVAGGTYVGSGAHVQEVGVADRNVLYTRGLEGEYRVNAG